jgi:hypothetical protein
MLISMGISTVILDTRYPMHTALLLPEERDTHAMVNVAIRVHVVIRV